MKSSVKFDSGQIVMTRGVNNKIAYDTKFAIFVQKSLQRHLHGDWGDLEREDKAENEYSLNCDLRLLSKYMNRKTSDYIWIITEADRSVTTILFPDEY